MSDVINSNSKPTYEELENEIAELKKQNGNLRLNSIKQNEKKDNLELELIEEKSKAEESEEKYRLLYESNQMPISVFDTETLKFLSVNNAFVEKYGYTREEFLNMTILKIRPESEIKKVEESVKVEDEGLVNVGVYLHKKKNGEIIHVEIIRHDTVFDGRNAKLVFVNDVTDRIEIENKLKRMTGILKNSQEIAHLGSFEYVEANQSTIWSEEEYNIYGLNPDEPSPEYNEILEKHIHPDDAELLHDTFISAIQNKEVYELEHRIVRPDGSVRWVYDRAHPFFDKSGNLIRYVGATLDVTERKKVEQEIIAAKEKAEESEKALKQSVDLMKYIIEHNRSAVAVHDKDFKYIYVSQKYLEEYNLKGENIIGKHHYDVFPDLPQKWRDVHKKALLGNVSSAEDDPYYKNDGTVVWTRWECRPWYENGNTIGGFIVYTEVITERKKMELELLTAKEQASSSLQQIKIIQANTPNIIWKWDFDKGGNFKNVYISEAADEFLALPKGSIGNSITKFFSYILPKYLPFVDDAIKNAINNPNKIFSLEYEVKKADGKLAWLSSSGKVILENEKLTIYGSTIDITEKKQNELDLIKAKEKAEESEEQYKLIAENASDVVWIIDFETNKLKYVSPSIKLQRGYTQEEAMSQGFNEYLTPESLEYLSSKIPERIERFKQGIREYFNDELEQFCKDGSTIWTEVKAKYVKNKKTGKVEIVGVTRDITEQKKYQNELITAKEKAEENEEQLDFVLLGSNLAYWDWNIETNVVKRNRRWAEMLGYTLEEIELTVNQWTDFIYPDDRDKAWSSIKDHLEDNTSFHQLEYRMLTKKGQIKWILDSAKIVSRDNKGNPIRMSGTHLDITEQKQQENELIKAKEKAEESDHLKSAFLANMSHEIRTPMNGILGFTELLRDDSLSVENQRDYVDIIKKSGDRLLNTVNDIIEISKIESGDINVTKSDFDIIGHLDTQVTFFRPEAKKKNIDIVVQNNIDGYDLSITTDKNKLSSILSNLIKNAIKYTDEGTINVGLRIENNQILFSCQDTGIGIPKNRQEAIFNRFEQADIEDKHAHQGSGLGLAIVKTYVEMLDGKIWVVSEEGLGSVFYVSLPFKHEKKKKQSIAQEAKSSDSGIKNINVLVAEDEEYSSMHISILMKDKVKNINTVKNGIEAVDACKKDSGIDLILMDIKMPVMDGIEATKKIREFNKDVIIIAQTAYALEGDKEKAIEAGCNDYISKPIKKDKLFELINKYF